MKIMNSNMLSRQEYIDISRTTSLSIKPGNRYRKIDW